MVKKEDFYEFSNSYPYYKKFNNNFTAESTITMSADVDWNDEYSKYKISIYFSSEGNLEHGFIPEEIEDQFNKHLQSYLASVDVDLNDVDFKEVTYY